MEEETLDQYAQTSALLEMLQNVSGAYISPLLQIALRAMENEKMRQEYQAFLMLHPNFEFVSTVMAHMHHHRILICMQDQYFLLHAISKERLIIKNVYVTDEGESMFRSLLSSEKAYDEVLALAKSSLLDALTSA